METKKLQKYRKNEKISCVNLTSTSNMTENDVNLQSKNSSTFTGTEFNSVKTSSVDETGSFFEITTLPNPLNLIDISGAGMIPYDENGIWLLTEVRNNKKILSDAGGRYRFEDIDILGCIAREWNEETYFSSEIRKKDVIELISRKESKYSKVKGDNGRITYVIYFFYVKNMTELGINIPSNEDFQSLRKSAIQKNRKNSHQYISTDINYYTFDELILGELEYNGRLKKVLKNLHKLNSNSKII